MKITQRENTILMTREPVDVMRPSGMIVTANRSPCFGCSYYQHCLGNDDQCAAFRSYTDGSQPASETSVKICGAQVPDRVKWRRMVENSI
jgi:hypothetical protein